MIESQLAPFIDAIKTDLALKQQLSQAQQDAMADIRSQTDAIAAVAREAGFDLSEWAKRPTDMQKSPQDGDLRCSMTCCLVGTSTL